MGQATAVCWRLEQAASGRGAHPTWQAGHVVGQVVGEAPASNESVTINSDFTCPSKTLSSLHHRVNAAQGDVG